MLPPGYLSAHPSSLRNYTSAGYIEYNKKSEQPRREEKSHREPRVYRGKKEKSPLKSEFSTESPTFGISVQRFLLSVISVAFIPS
jgi:hypothetical protein